MQGPLSLLKAWWEGNSSEAPKNNVIDYVITKLHKLHQMTELAAAHVRERRKKQNMWYDRNAKLRSFKSVQKVLIMPPTSENKLLGKWYWPFKGNQEAGYNDIPQDRCVRI